MKPALRSALAVLAAMSGILLVFLALLFAMAVFMAARQGMALAQLVTMAVLATVSLAVAAWLIWLAGRALRPVRTVQIGIGMVLVAAVVMLGWLQQRGVFDRSKIRLADGVLLIQGRLDRDLLAEFRSVIATADLRDVRVRLRSRGGDIHAGMAMGREIHRRQLDVEVDVHCISSCANYLFTAGRNKYVRSPGHVKFHGGALQPDFVDGALALLGQGQQAVSAEGLPPESELRQWRELHGLADGYPINAAAQILAEKAFFEEIGVSALTPVYGQYGDYAAWFMDGVHDNFYYLPEDYALFGVTNVIVTEPVTDSGSGARLFRASASAAGIDALQAEMAQVYATIEAAMPFAAGDIWRRESL